MKLPRIALGLIAVLLLSTLFGCFLFPSDGTLVINVTNLPSDIASIDVTVTGDGFDPIQTTYDTDSGSWEPITVPSGSDRSFTVVVKMADTVAGPVTEWTAKGTVDIADGEPTNVDATLLVSGTKLVIPDAVNDRIVQIDDISGANWDEYATAGSTYDTEVGPDGRIYFSVYGELYELWAMDDISGTNATIIGDNQGNNGANLGFYPTYIGIDQVNGWIYYASGYELARVSLDGTVVKSYSTAIADYMGVDNPGIVAVTVDDNGIVYLLHGVGTSVDEIELLKFDATGNGSVVDTKLLYNVAESGIAYDEADVVAKGDKLYVVLPGGPFQGDTSYGPVVELDTNLQIQGTYGEMYNGQLNQQPADVVYGPERFVGHRNPRLQFIDEYPYGGVADRVYQIDSIAGDGIETYGSTGLATGEFEFFVTQVLN